MIFADGSSPLTDLPMHKVPCATKANLRRIVQNTSFRPFGPMCRVASMPGPKDRFPAGLGPWACAMRPSGIRPISRPGQRIVGFPTSCAADLTVNTQETSVSPIAQRLPNFARELLFNALALSPRPHGVLPPTCRGLHPTCKKDTQVADPSFLHRNATVNASMGINSRS